MKCSQPVSIEPQCWVPSAKLDKGLVTHEEHDRKRAEAMKDL